MPIEERLLPRPHKRLTIKGDGAHAGKDMVVVVTPDDQASCVHVFNGAPVANKGALRVVDLDAVMPWSICAACAKAAGVEPKLN